MYEIKLKGKDNIVNVGKNASSLHHVTCLYTLRDL